MIEKKSEKTEQTWLDFQKKYQLTDVQLNQFSTYYDLLLEFNQRFNLTAITEEKSVIADHFEDSLAVTLHMDFSRVASVCDIGAGAGFPGIPLKIMNPQLELFLIEVSGKKVYFLHKVIEALQLDTVKIITFDWRTFLRTTAYEIDLFVARASLQPEELIRFLQPSSIYKDATLVYWASQLWQPSNRVSPFIQKDISYKINDKDRRLIFFQIK